MASTTTSDPEAQRIVSIQDLAAQISELRSMVGSTDAGAGKTPASGGGAGSVDDQVRQAVARAREDDQARTQQEQARQATEDRIKALEARTERRPLDLKRLTRFMWGAPDDDR